MNMATGDRTSMQNSALVADFIGRIGLLFCEALLVYAGLGLFLDYDKFLSLLLAAVVILFSGSIFFSNTFDFFTKFPRLTDKQIKFRVEIFTFIFVLALSGPMGYIGGVARIQFLSNLCSIIAPESGVFKCVDKIDEYESLE